MTFNGPSFGELALSVFYFCIASVLLFQFLNIVLKNVMGRMNLDLIGRNFYDKKVT